MMVFKQHLNVLFTACFLFTARAQEIPRAEVSNNLPSQIDEGSDFEVCVMLDAEPITEVRVNIRTIEPSSSAREDADYSSVDRTLTFIPPSADSQCVIISILDDNAIEGLEFFIVSVTSSDVTLGGSVSLTPLVIDTTVPNFEFVQSSYTVTEDDEDTSDDVCVTAINTVFEDATGLSSIIEISAVGGSAIADEDFAFPTELRTFLPSTPEGRLCFSPEILDDDIAEDLESYTLSFTSTIFTDVTGTTTIYIQDDDATTQATTETTTEATTEATTMSPVPEVAVEFERQFYSVVEGQYIQLCVVIVSGDVIFQDIILDVQVSAKQFYNVSGRIFLEVGISAGERRCTELHFPNDYCVSIRVQEFELGLLPLEFYPQLSFGTNVPAWLFLVESSDVSCRQLPNPLNGMVTLTDTASVDSITTYTCNEMYILVGDSTRQCQLDGTWSGFDPTCQPDFSDCQICSPNADCVRISEEMISCRCSQGYEGDGITCTNINECLLDQNNCDSNADCFDIDGGFGCNCREGYSGSGTTCENLSKHITISTTAACAIVGVVCSIVFYIGGVVSVLLIHYAITRSKQGAVTTSGRSDTPNTNSMYENIDVMLPQPDQAGIELQENVAYN